MAPVTAFSTPDPAPLPEAAFSLCLRGTLAGQDAQLTIRGASYAEFAANVAAVRGLLDPPAGRPAPVQVPTNPPPAEGWCPVHQVPMERQSNARGSWWSHKTAEGWCKGR
jgi:hypothetical protein